MESVRRSIITVRVRRADGQRSGCTPWPWPCRDGKGNGRPYPRLNNPAQAEAARAHTHRASLCARETVPKAELHCSLSNRFFLLRTSLFFFGSQKRKTK
jgi:hypothetical protein